jgi:hypothetical protein
MDKASDRLAWVKSKNLPSSPAIEIERHVGFSNEPGGFEVGLECGWCGWIEGGLMWGKGS